MKLRKKEGIAHFGKYWSTLQILESTASLDLSPCELRRWSSLSKREGGTLTCYAAQEVHNVGESHNILHCSGPQTSDGCMHHAMVL